MKQRVDSKLADGNADEPEKFERNSIEIKKLQMKYTCDLTINNKRQANQNSNKYDGNTDAKRFKK
jgi:hypothetical protein